MLVSTHLYHLLLQLRESQSPNWVLATVVRKFRSSYRQPGAMMMVDPDGLSLGLVSGGCLEADIRLNSRKVLAFDEPRCLLYDSSEEGNIAAELGLGCNGRVKILVQAIKPSHRELLLLLLERMEAGKDSFLIQCFESDNQDDLNSLILLDEKRELVFNATNVHFPNMERLPAHGNQLVKTGKQHWSLNRHENPINLWIVGGGVDAQPLVKLAASLGWRITLADHRPAYARREDFPLAEAFVREHPATLKQPIDADAAVLMTHNLRLDAEWLARIINSQSLRYIGLLGPVERKQEVLALAGIDPSSGLDGLLHGPMGFDIGGDIPESVALSTLAQCHQILFRPEPSQAK